MCQLGPQFSTFPCVTHGRSDLGDLQTVEISAIVMVVGDGEAVVVSVTDSREINTRMINKTQIKHYQW